MANTKHRAIAFAVLAFAAILASAFLAQAAGRFAAVWFLPLDAEGLETHEGTAPPPSTTPESAYNPESILRRNIFDSTTGDVLRVAQTETPQETTTESEEWDPSKPLGPCDGNLRLVGALVHSRTAERSFAAITEGGGEAELFRQDTEVSGHRVVLVRTSSVVLRPTSGPLCQLAMFDPTARSQAGPTPAPAVVQAARRRSANSTGPDAETLDRGITKVSDSQYTIQRSLVDSLLEDQTAMMKLARVIPHQENGRTVGVKLYGIRRNSVLGRLGIQNGDMLRTINGFDMADATGVLEAFSKLRNADQLSVSLVRRGTPQTVEYQIQ